MKIAFYALRDFDELAFAEKFSKQYGIDFVWTAEYPNEHNLELAKGCDGVSCTPCEMREEWVRTYHSYGVKYMLTRAIGYDHLPAQLIKELDMHISTTPYPTECVAEYALMLILCTIRKFQQSMIRAAAQDYTLKGKMGKDLCNCTVGVVGTGHIGQILIKYLSGFGCHILAFDRFPKKEIAGQVEYVDLDTLYAQSDVISLHVPSTNDTFHMIDQAAIDKMKDGVIIINTARGNVIDSKALIASLKSGKIGGAGLDVIENEAGLYYCNRMGDHIDNDELAMLRSFPNVIVSPHLAFYVESTVSNMVEKNFIAIDALRKGELSPFEIKL